jgi:hypothetical protein
VILGNLEVDVSRVVRLVREAVERASWESNGTSCGDYHQPYMRVDEVEGATINGLVPIVDDRPWPGA